MTLNYYLNFFLFIYNCVVVYTQGIVGQALFLGDSSKFNTTRDDCVWKVGNDRDQCPDEDITMTLYPANWTRPKSRVWLNFIYG